ncbi:MAG: 2-dehydro-3-deoxy-D-gluconate 5-dehydrogenase KduD [Puniceicoccales bacterium]|jgi:2-deoxy-D-gluconate 3-dehydrogenase|nr:2-dehydro-3-deoxy-D-gluconate 5-dehydrogenase KduD [Puniceicoccales bacterium]
MSNNILELFKLDGKTAIVTGANRGLGQSIALALAGAGADVAAVSLHSPDDTVAQIRALGRRAVAISADLGDRAAIPAVFAEIKKHFPAPGILVNNAGIIRRADFLDFTAKDWDDVLGVNLDAAFFLSQLFVKDVLSRAAKGKIIHIASMLSFQGGIRVPSYTASKSALAGLTRLMANELAAKGINTNAIAPGYMATDNTAALRADAARSQAILERIPAGRWGDPSDLNGAAVFLASAASDYMNGHILAVDGGWLAR